MIATGYHGPMTLEDANLIVEIAVMTGRTIAARKIVPDLIVAEESATLAALW